MGTTRTPALVPIRRSLQLLVHAPDADGYCRHADRVLLEFPDKKSAVVFTHRTMTFGETRSPERLVTLISASNQGQTND